MLLLEMRHLLASTVLHNALCPDFLVPHFASKMDMDAVFTNKTDDKSWMEDGVVPLYV